MDLGAFWSDKNERQHGGRERNATRERDRTMAKRGPAGQGKVTTANNSVITAAISEGGETTNNSSLTRQCTCLETWDESADWHGVWNVSQWAW